MRIRSKAGLGLATIVAAVGAFAPTAWAQDAGDWQIVAPDPATLCREVFVGGIWQTVCVEAGTNKRIATGATVAPYVRIGCSGQIDCIFPTIGVGTTGFLANPNFPPPELRPGLTVYHPGGWVGTAYANGASVSVSIPEFCVGDPDYCPGGLVLPLPAA